MELIQLLLPPANEVCEGYVFTGVCLSMGVGVILFASGPRGGIYLWSWGCLPHTPGQTPACPVHAGIWSTSRRYASSLECILVLIPMNNTKLITILVSLNLSQWNPSLSPLNVLRFKPHIDFSWINIDLKLKSIFYLHFILIDLGINPVLFFIHLTLFEHQLHKIGGDAKLTISINKQPRSL